MRLEPRPMPETPLFPSGLPPLAVQQPLPFDRVISILSARIDRHEQKMEQSFDRLRSTQLTVCEQLKDLRANLPMQRRPLSGWVQRIHVDVLNLKRGGLCPCCEETPVCSPTGRLPAAEFDHWFARNRARAEETWLVCSECNARLNTTEFKASVRSAFESYQLALRRVLQARQSAQMDMRQSAAS
jgi:hypothetical protein